MPGKAPGFPTKSGKIRSAAFTTSLGTTRGIGDPPDGRGNCSADGCMRAPRSATIAQMPKFTTRLRARHPYLSDFLDDDETNQQAELLRSSGLDVLNERVLASPRAEVLDVVAEHNMAAMLLRRDFTDVLYEPPSMQRPVDLLGAYAGTEYRVEVKRLAASKHDELHSTVMHTLNKALESSGGGILIQMQLRASFEAQ